MMHGKGCMLYMVGFLFLTPAASRTETRKSISDALEKSVITARATDNAGANYISTQYELPDSRDENDWAVAKHQMLTSVISRLSNVTSVEDILNLGLKSSGGRPLTAEDLSAFYDNKTDKLLINGNGELAKAAVCAPREVLINVEVPVLPADTFIFPLCIKVFQCGGCCNVDNVNCIPVATKRVVYNLLKFTVARGDRTTRVDGVYPVEVTEHTACSCRCSLSQESCGPLKTVDDRICSCYCKSPLRCHPPHYFNPETCKCECAQTSSCCPGARYCGIIFNETTCDCQQVSDKMYIASGSNQNQGQRNNNITRVSEGNQAAGSQTTPRIFQDTRLRPSDSCLGVICPIMLVTRLNSEGRCVCTTRKGSLYRGLK
ncbi:unnamed protein product [Candidula unifasciata]|uniref:Platelet-derived growth factor (PDGF) family profile domain-containing protein n=1 Tax=Candidula unifasciata TaxID=100452 RepID=A0A8S3YQT7_9EUPU|nr:unnamed protein product [Candidula unifasciata]